MKFISIMQLVTTLMVLHEYGISLLCCHVLIVVVSIDYKNQTFFKVRNNYFFVVSANDILEELINMISVTLYSRRIIEI